MKLFVTFVACIYLAQVCYGAPAGDAASSESSEYITDEDIAEMRSDLQEIPGINSKSIDDFATTLTKFRKHSTEEETLEGVLELLGMAVEGPTCSGKSKIDLKKMMKTFSSEESKETKADSSSSEDLSEDELKAFDDELTKLVTPEQKNHAMRILGAFGKGKTEDEKVAAMTDLFMSAMLSLRKVC